MSFQPTGPCTVTLPDGTEFAVSGFEFPPLTPERLARFRETAEPLITLDAMDVLAGRQACKLVRDNMNRKQT